MKKIFLIFCLVILVSASFAQKVTTVDVFTTADSTKYRLSKTVTLNFTEKGQPFENEITVFVDPSKTFQTYMGIGGAITDAAAETFYKLPENKRKELLNAYYSSASGIGYTIARTNINSCDFSSDMYTYVNENDKTLASFSIDHDKKYKIPFLKEANATAANKLTIFASPWSPPSWMKTNNDMLHGGKLKKEFYQTWADYFIKFIKTYEKEGVNLWGVSIQNEPMATQIWESCLYTAEEEKDFLKNNLGPSFEKAGLSNKKIIVWDHNRDMMYQRAQTYFSDPVVVKYAWGMGFHWYEDWSGGTPMYDNVKRVHESFPNEHLLFTEGCAESFNASRYYAWVLGEKYAKSMINDFNNGMEGFTDWNILLDETGGPNHVGNFCFAPVHADTRTGELIYTNAYYYIGHFSKFIKPGAKRIISSASRSQLMTTAFKNPDGKVVVIVMNPSDKIATYNLWINGKAAVTEALPHSISTLVF